jgi:uncharacterized protein (TIGR00375 family)
MRFFADLHIHSRFSRATSKYVSLESLWKWAQIKGISVIGTGDFTHPQWYKELNEKLDINNNNLLKLRDKYKVNSIPDSCVNEVSFMLTTEVSCIYSKNGRVRKIHSLIFVPDFAAASKLSHALSKIGNISSDGRPILGLDAKTLLKIVLDISHETMFVPAHAWTPHFSVFGASSGFDSLEECFDELTPNIYAIETGLSSNPAMNWRLSSLDTITLISNSDAHSPAKIGREANIFDTSNTPLPPFSKGGHGGITEISYEFITHAIKTKQGFAGTIEFFPEEGKYHYDGHRSCGVNLSPEETVRHHYLCPACGKKVTVGVMHRVDKLADREDGFKPSCAPPFYSMIPLQEIIAETKKVGVSSKAVTTDYLQLIEKLGNELKILMDLPLDEIETASSPLLKEAISRVRSGNVHIAPGYDGEYGKIKILEEVERREIKEQRTLF